MDALQMLIDEVALEGLDGITISSLWIRLEDRHPKFPLKLDPSTKEFLWKSLVCDPDIELYELPRERAQLILFDRFSEIDPETGIQEIRRASPSQDIQEDPYPVKVIQENEDGIQGSCQYFEERKHITSQVRTIDFKPCQSLEDAIDKWGVKLVLVASQRVRFRALIGSEGDPDLKLSDHSYCILERLGRARWQGELQRDLHSRVFKTDPGKMHYLRRSLDRNDLITLQSHVIRVATGGQQYSILILLKRFHVDRRSKYDILMEKTSNLLAATPRQMCVMIKLREQLSVSERTFKRVYQYMMAAKLVQIVSLPLEELNPAAGPCKTKRGTDIMVRCLKLLREYGKKEEDEDENDEEDGYRNLPHSEGPIKERDILMQAYEIVVSSGTKGISQSTLRMRMNVGKLEGRMICRLLERNKMIKGFMEDQGRQRTTKFISKIYVEQSDLNRQFVKEKARSEQLRTGDAADVCEVEVALSPPAEDMSLAQEEQETSKRRQPPSKGSSSKRPAKNSKKTVKDTSSLQTPLKQTKLNFSTQQSAKILSKALTPRRVRGCMSTQVVQNLDMSLDSSSSQSACSSGPANNDSCMMIVEEVVPQKESRPLKGSAKRIQKPHQTYRLLKRKNLIIETIRSVKLIDNLYSLQRMIMDEEKQDGVSTKCCKKSILRLLKSLSKEGMLRLFCTTVIQDGVSKKVELVVHPSITPDDPLVKSAIEQIRFRLSSSYSVNRAKVLQADGEAEQQKGDDTGGKVKGASPSKMAVSKSEKARAKQLKDFKPSIVPGLGRSRGFQPKVPRLRLVHMFLWYLIYGHSMRRAPAEDKGSSAEEEGAEPGQSESANQSAESESSSQAKGKSSTGMAGDKDRVDNETDDDQLKVYVDELSWRRFIPPTPLHREFSYGWALTSDMLLSLPLSLFVKIIQVSYQVDGLEAYLNDPVKQHYPIRHLPGKLKMQLLYKRKYIFSFHECMQRLCYMGLMQFGPFEKFQDKDQIFVYLRKKATIVDTTTCEPHYNIAVSSRPFERRSYTFDTLQDVENYWFDLQCVCLNTPLGLIRGPRRRGQASAGSVEEDEAEPAVEHMRPNEKYLRVAYTLKGRAEVTDDGVIPGDGKGAGGMDSSFYSHLKRNWIWTSYLLSRHRKADSSFESNPTLRLNNLLSKHPLPLSVPCSTKMKNSMGLQLPVMEEEVQITTESSSRNLRVVGGKKQKRKRQKKESVKQATKKKKVVNPPNKRPRTPFHDEADLSALKRMTRQRVTWTLQEDSLLMLCRVASHFLNRKIKKPFVPWQVVRDLLHAQFEESLDKTSLSVGRRSRYIMKNPQTFLNFKICLAEVYQDKSLVEEFQNRCQNYEDSEVCASEFKEFVTALRQKFSAASGDCSFEIPNTKQELFRRFKVYAIGEDSNKIMKDQLKSTEDIHSLVLNNLIQSTLVLSPVQMRSCRSFQTFHIYSRYKEQNLFQAFMKCQKRGLVNRRRVHKVFGPKKCRALPFLPMSYQLSQTYYRCFTWRIPNTVCTESYEFLEALRSCGREDRPNTFIFRNHMIESEPEPESDMIPFPLDAPGGACVTGMSLIMMGLLYVELSIPEQIVVVDSTLVENEALKSAGKDAVEDDEDDDMEEGEGKKKFEVKARQASHTNYLLMRGYSAPGIVSMRNLNPNDNVVVNSCTIRVKLRDTPAHSIFRADWDSSFIDSELQGEACLPSRLTHLMRLSSDSGCLERFSNRCVDQYGYSAEDLQAALDIHSAIEATHSFGCDRLELSQDFSALMEVQDGRTRTFHQYLRDLVNLEEVLEVGGNSVRMVAVKYAEPWLVHIHTPERMAAKSEDLPSQKATPRKRSLPQEGEEQQVPPSKRPTLTIENEEESELHGKAEPASSHAAEGRDLSEQSTGPKSDAETPVEEAAKGEGKEGPGGNVSSPASASLAQSSESTHPLHPQTKDRDGSPPGSVFEKVSFISRPWRVVDGSLNRPVCKGMLESLLFHIMSKPGLPESVLIDHYNGVLQPVVILDLLQGLEEIGCVQKKVLKGRPRATLFSPLRASEPKEDGVKFRDVTFYEPTVDGCLRLSKVFPHEPNWNKWVPFIHS
ncbi:general transcription factor 3C polypeptide 1 [Conger conger]|uniref:general transcription factor 3C polypeptide 1 n=1 Tax=Conger conger TaxID=82655 RepID=UPI002A5AC9A1|nr:general transcription factor 3C polypeptide 1 [Conger conger]